ncbi:hypothetical protein AVO44_17850 [Ruegeria profundi]|uniref:Solute-binding protein family 3/N-terminal domain-containing protein n=1 Tax=Ruegeria profundi TaxID=1685378 RepID=A0A0X3TNB6_9RHOB|nr:hypothetical protein AVO44_17850 [Ruegeria profundi]
MFFRLDQMIRPCVSTVLLSCTLTFLPMAAMPCGFHAVSARESVVSSLMDGAVVVLATTDPDMPFQYKASEAIKGDLTEAEIPFLVDSTTRRKLGSNLDGRVLFAKNAETGNWARLAYIDTSNRQVFQHILSNLEAWSTQRVSRYQFFGSLLSHKEPSIRNMALTELDQAPYSILQTLDTSSDTQTLLGSFSNPREMYLKPAKILTLGFSDSEAAGQFLLQGFERSLTHAQDRLLGAYATAIIERDGLDGVNKVSAAVSAASHLSAESQDAIFQAMMIHYLHGPRQTREAIAKTLRHWIVNDPGFAEIARNSVAARPDSLVPSQRRGIRF